MAVSGDILLVVEQYVWQSVGMLPGCPDIAFVHAVGGIIGGEHRPGLAVEYRNHRQGEGAYHIAALRHYMTKPADKMIIHGGIVCRGVYAACQGAVYRISAVYTVAVFHLLAPEIEHKEDHADEREHPSG